MNLVLIQSEIVWEDKQANFRRIEDLVEDQKLDPDPLVVLPEMFATGFSMNASQIAENVEGETSRFLSRLSGSLGAQIVAGRVVAEEGNYFNEAICLGSAGQVAARYQKQHPFSFAGEDRCYTRGRALAQFRWMGFSVAPFVCYDLRFPEIYRAAAIGGAEILVTIANWPAPRIDHWTALLRARAIENQAYAVGVNRTGSDPDHVYPGRTVVFGPRGECLVEAGSDETVIQVILDREDLLAFRKSFPVLPDTGDSFREWSELQ